MNRITEQILRITEAEAITRTASVQTLWSGYGEIKRYFLKGGKYPSIIVKHIQLPEESNHPRGWNTEISHLRKLKSYQVETNWYQHFSQKTNDDCKVPGILKTSEQDGELLLVMEDLDASGYTGRLQPDNVTLADAKGCLSWLAHFHATFMGAEAKGLWPIGTYWHLETRPDEWDRMGNQPLKSAAAAIDERLNTAKYQTLVHGDAKLANFCFHPNGEVAAVDFQYVGRGCGMKDVAYFISSCFDNQDCERYESELLDEYFNQLEMSLENYTEFQELKAEWMDLYAYAWADLYRFLDGWSPGHWKLHGYSERMTQQVLDELNP
ncbi:MAG: phosphotransferase [Cyclobacteriaceae bacterium]